LATDRFQSWQQAHLKRSVLVSKEAA
jgi:hypothetical protein